MNIQKQNDLKSISKANEEWIEVFGGRYAVSNLGRVVSFYFKDKYRIKEMVQRKSAGYLRVHLHILGRSKLVSVHRLVAMAFVPNISNLPEVNHINGDKEDNQSTNLEWVTKSQNKLHSIYVLKREHPMLGKRLYDSYIHRGVIQYSLDQ